MTLKVIEAWKCFPAFLGNETTDRPTKTNQPTDGHEGLSGSYTFNNTRGRDTIESWLIEGRWRINEG